MKVERLVLRNFRGFVDTKIDSQNRNLTVIVGENGSGKSSILGDINKLLSGVNYNLNGKKRKHLVFSQNSKVG